MVSASKAHPDLGPSALPGALFAETLSKDDGREEAAVDCLELSCHIYFFGSRNVKEASQRLRSSGKGSPLRTVAITTYKP